MQLSNSYCTFPVEKPFLFNALKHHAGYIRSFIEKCIGSGEDILPALSDRLKSIGGSQMDLYTGNLALAEISVEISCTLRQKGLFPKERYLEWLKDNKGYRTLEVSDKSVWVLLEGNIPEHYIHIHPARHSLHTIRIRAGTLKSAVAVHIWSGIYNESPFNVNNVNIARKKLLCESPVKNLSHTSGLGALIKLLSSA